LVLAGSTLAQNRQVETVPLRVAKAVPNTVDEISGIRVPDSKLARDAAQVILDSEGGRLFQHSMRVYYWAALAGTRKGLTFDSELLYVAAMFHDYGLMEKAIFAMKWTARTPHAIVCGVTAFRKLMARQSGLLSRCIRQM
jgi:HD-GYP domain-containing protein (c-di-GMP phosphodiesterase class II)